MFANIFIWYIVTERYLSTQSKSPLHSLRIELTFDCQLLYYIHTCVYTYILFNALQNRMRQAITRSKTQGKYNKNKNKKTTKTLE